MTSWPNTIIIGNILLDTQTPPSFRVVEALAGWDDAPGIRSGIASRSGQDGAWDAVGNLNERVIEIVGLIEEGLAADAYEAAQALAALRPQTVHTLTVINATLGTLTARTRVTVGVKPAWIDDRSFTYSIQLTAPDPVKYGPPTSGSATLSTATPGAGKVYPVAYPVNYGVAAGVTPGAVLVANVGTAAYWPTLRIDGPVTNPVVTNVQTGAWIRYSGSLLAGQWLDIDLAARTVLLQGLVSHRSKVTSSGDWLAVPPGSGSISWVADTADPGAVLSVYAYEGSYI